jgi:NAD(P)-dependent dehydrogenase (short-subunit alcohol dehydrogenase family)
LRLAVGARIVGAAYEARIVMRKWLVTGVSSGIGQALAQAALDRGDAVVGTARRDEDVAEFAALAPGRSHGLKLDVDRLDAIPAAVEQALALAGGIDIAVNNAGRSLFGAVEEVAADEVRALFETNFFGPLAVMQALLPHFRARGGGTFVTMSSGCGFYGTPGLGAYSASKFALEGLSETLAAETAGFGVRMVIVEPGAINSRFISHATGEAARRLPDYAFLSGGGKDALNAYYETGAEAAESVAEAVLAALDLPELPQKLVLGRDNRATIKGKLDAMLPLVAD